MHHPLRRLLAVAALALALLVGVFGPNLVSPASSQATPEATTVQRYVAGTVAQPYPVLCSGPGCSRSGAAAWSDNEIQPTSWTPDTDNDGSPGADNVIPPGTDFIYVVAHFDNGTVAGDGARGVRIRVDDCAGGAFTTLDRPFVGPSGEDSGAAGVSTSQAATVPVVVTDTDCRFAIQMLNSETDNIAVGEPAATAQVNLAFVNTD